MDGNAERIDRDWYDHSAYFDAGDHIRDFGSRFQRYRVAKVMDLARPAASDRVLDLGCGLGTISFALAPLVREVVGLDFSERAVATCDRELERQGLSNVVFRVGDARASGLAAGSFDLVVAADLFEHLYPEDSGSVAEEAFRLLRAGGAFAVWTPCRSHLLEVLKNNDIVLRRDVSHVDYKSMPRLEALLTDAGFRVERAYYAESHLPVLSWIERVAGRWIPLLRRRIAALGRKPG